MKKKMREKIQNLEYYTFSSKKTMKIIKNRSINKKPFNSIEK